MFKTEKAEQVRRAMQKVLQGSDGMLIFMFAANHPDIDMAPLQNRLLEVGGCLEIQRFAAEIPGADKSLCRARVMQIADGWEAYWFASDVQGSACLQDRVLLKGCAKSAYLFAKNIEGADVNRLYAFAKSKGFDGLDDSELAKFSSTQLCEAPTSKSSVVQILFRRAISPGIDKKMIHAIYKQAEALEFSGLTASQCESFKSLAQAAVQQEFKESV